MKLTPREVEKLALHGAGHLAQKRLARGLRLNYTEAVALIATQILEFVRDGDKSVAELMDIGKQLLGRRQVLPAVPYLLDMVQVEGTFRDGTKLITVHNAIASDDGRLELALHGSFLPVPALDKFLGNDPDDFPGELICGDGTITLNLGRKAVVLRVVNMADRPVQIGSHYHFVEVNPYLVFDRKRACGMRLNIPAGTATRFEPGEAKSVTLVSIGGKKVIRGGNSIVDGPVHAVQIENIMEAVRANGFGHEEYPEASEGIIEENSPFSVKVSHESYANMYGPTVGDKIRLGDTDLYAEIERDFAIYGDECVFGGGKVLRDGMGQATGYHPSLCLDTVITNAVIIDYTGIYKADIGIKEGIIFAIGKAGNPDVMDGVHDGMIIGVNTEVIAGEGMIITAGGIDCHVHFICPQLAQEAISSGITTLVGGGTGPADGTRATTCTPAPFQMQMMLQSTDELPINIGFTGKGNSSKSDGLTEIIESGAMGLKLHEDWGSTPAAIDKCLEVADTFDIQVNIHTDTLNESGCVEHTIAAFKGRTIHTYHSEGAGGGHAPDIIKVCGVKNVLPSSTNPTRPFTKNTVDEHLDMLLVCHHLDRDIPEDVAFAESRIRAETIAAEDILHDMGAISIISSDSQAMGRIGEVITRTWQTAHKMKLQRGRSVEPPSSGNDNFRIKRYVAKYTINPAIANGFSELVGSVEVRKSPSLLSLPRVQIAPLPPHSIRRTPAPGRKTRGPRHVEAFFLRCQAGDGDQGRRRCVGKHGGPQRQHPHPRAGDNEAHVWRVRQGGQRELHSLCEQGCEGGRRGGKVPPEEEGGGRRRRARPHKAGHEAERRPAEDRGRPRDLHRDRRRGGSELRPGELRPPLQKLLPVLACCSLGDPRRVDPNNNK